MDETHNNLEQPVTHIEDQLAACHKETAEWKDKSMRIQADFENYRRRSEKERAHWMHSVKADVIVPILAIVDDVERALASSSAEADRDKQAWLEGFILIGKSLNKLLESYGVTPIPETTTFDPVQHEAIMSVPATEAHPAGSIVAVLQKGYQLNGTVVRPAKVSVAQ